MSRYTTASFTSSAIAPGGYVDYEQTVSASSVNLAEVYAVSSVARGGCYVELYRAAARGASDLIWSSGSFATSYVTPRVKIGTPAEEQTPWYLPYEDTDSLRQLHWRIWGDGGSKTVALTVKYDVPTSGASVSLNAFDVTSYGAVGDGVTDDTAAIQAAGAALQAAGGGTLYFPRGSYLVGSAWNDAYFAALGSAYTSMCAFTGIEGLNIISDGAEIIGGMDSAEDTNHGQLFLIKSCVNVKIDGFKVYQARTAATNAGGLWFLQEGTGGVSSITGSRNVSITNNYLDGMLASVAFVGLNDGNLDRKARNIYIGNLYVKNSAYGPSFQNSGNNVTIDSLTTDGVGRSYFPYGVNNHRVQITEVAPHQTNPSVLLRAGGGYGDMNDIDISYTNIGNDDTGYLIGIQFATTAGRVRNVRINLDIETTATASPNYAVYVSADTGGVGHTLSGLLITGRSAGDNILSVSTLTAADTIRNYMVRNFTSVLSSTASSIDISAFSDNLTLDNVYHYKDITLSGTPKSTFRLNCIGVQANNLNTGVGFSGTTAAIASGDTVAHGMQVTPAQVLVTATTTGPSAIFVDTITATTFKINYTGTGPYVFHWIALR